MKQSSIPYEHSFKWTVYGMSVGAFFMVMAAIWGITRVIDGHWLSWQLPAVIGIITFVIVAISAMFTSLGDVKAEIDKELNKAKIKEKSEVKEIKTK